MAREESSASVGEGNGEGLGGGRGVPAGGGGRLCRGYLESGIIDGMGKGR